jgi:hypothetical protein
MSPFPSFMSALHIAMLYSWNQLILSTTQSATSAQILRNLPVSPLRNKGKMPRGKQFDLVEKNEDYVVVS